MKKILVTMILAFVIQVESQTPNITISLLDANVQFPVIPGFSGKSVVFVDYRSFVYSLYHVDIDTKQEQLKLLNTGYTEPQVRISGNRVVWIGYPTTTQADVYVRNIQTNTTTRITNDIAFQNFPDIYGNQVVWQDYRNRPDTNSKNADIYLYNFSTGLTQQITFDTSYQSFPAIWGNRIVWQDYRNAKVDTLNADIYMYNLSTGQETQITTNSAYQTHPDIWEDKIVWGDFRNGTGDIYMYDMSSAQERAISTFPAYKTHPVIYRDWIVWQDYRNGTDQGEIWGYNLITNQEYPLVVQPDHQDFPQLDSNNIVWQDFRNARQDLYLAVITWSSPTVTVTSPNGGETLIAGNSYTITWTALGVSAVKLEYSTNNGGTWSTIVSSTPASAGSYNWTVLNTPTTQGLMRVSDASSPNVNDVSNTVFSIVIPTVVVTSPNGGETWLVGNTHNITWTSSYVTNIKIEYSTNNGISWQMIISNTPASGGNYNWIIPNTQTTTALVRVSDTAGLGAMDVSDGVFTITAPSTVSLASPNGGEIWIVGTIRHIQWSPTSVSTLRLEYSTDAGTNWINISDNVASLSGSYSWAIPATTTYQALVRVSDMSNFAVNDVSDSLFAILVARSYSVYNGWNMVSLPLTIHKSRKTVLFPSAISDAFSYQGGYKLEDILENGIGYWLKFDGDQDVIISGAECTVDTIIVTAGWNMIGSISDTISVSSVVTEPSGIIISNFFGYNGLYTVTNLILPGKSYWVKVNVAGKIILSR